MGKPEHPHIFGPVPSRRLGISLGIDIIPFKTCTLSCIYCECGKTNNLTIQRKRFVDAGTILSELKKFAATFNQLNYITFSGSGEPTLNKDLGRMIMEMKKLTNTPVAVLTNGTLLYLKEVRDDLMRADLVLPSLDAATDETFQRINQPHKDLKLDTIIQGLVKFREEFRGEIWLEVLIVKGINEKKEELDQLHHRISTINPDRVQLNSVDRPAPYEFVQPVSTGVLERIAQAWNDLPVEVIKRTRKRKEILSFSRDLENSILNTLDRRPLMIEDLEALTGKNRLELYKYIDILEQEKKIAVKVFEDKIFYVSNNIKNEEKQFRFMVD